MTAKWYNFSIRSTSTGSGTWAGGGLNNTTDVDPQDSSNVTNLLLGAVGPPPGPLYSSNTEFDHTNYPGRYYGFDVQPANTDNSKTNSGSEPLLGGSGGLNPAGRAIQIDLLAGSYDFRAALGSASAQANQQAVLFQDTIANLGAVITLSSLTIWAASTAFALNKVIASTVDGSVWKCTTAGTSGSTIPSGGTSPFTDNTAVWTKQAGVKALLVLNGTNGATPATNVMDQNNATVAASAWKAGATVTVAPAVNSVTLVVANTTTRPRQLGFRAQAVPLADVTLTDQFGVTLAGLYAAQPNQKLIAKIATNPGGAAITITESDGVTPSAYLTTRTVGLETWLCATSTRLPATTPYAFKIVQTGASFSNSPYAESFSLPVTSDQNKPTTGPFSLIPTEAWLRRELIRSTVQGGWTDWRGQAFYQTPIKVFSLSDLFTTMQTQAASAGVNRWFSLVCSTDTVAAAAAGKTVNWNADYATSSILLTDFLPDLGGGCLVVPDLAYPPKIGGKIATRCLRGVQFGTVGARLIVCGRNGLTQNDTLISIVSNYDFYVASGTYGASHLVQYGGAVYLPKATVTGHLPTDATYWTLQAGLTPKHPIVAFVGLDFGVFFGDDWNETQLLAYAAYQAGVNNASNNPVWGPRGVLMSAINDKIIIRDCRVKGTPSAFVVNACYRLEVGRVLAGWMLGDVLGTATYDPAIGAPVGGDGSVYCWMYDCHDGFAPQLETIAQIDTDPLSTSYGTVVNLQHGDFHQQRRAATKANGSPGNDGTAPTQYYCQEFVSQAVNTPENVYTYNPINLSNQATIRQFLINSDVNDMVAVILFPVIGSNAGKGIDLGSSAGCDAIVCYSSGIGGGHIGSSSATVQNASASEIYHSGAVAGQKAFIYKSLATYMAPDLIKEDCALVEMADNSANPGTYLRGTFYTDPTETGAMANRRLSYDLLEDTFDLATCRKRLFDVLGAKVGTDIGATAITIDILPGGNDSLTLTQAGTLLAITDHHPVGATSPGLTERWRRSAGNTGPLDGYDAVFNVA